MKKIYKYQVLIADESELELPERAKILTFQAQNDEAYIWAIIDTDIKTIEKVKFRMFGTGHSIREIDGLKYIGTIQIYNGSLVWHLFRVN